MSTWREREREKARLKANKAEMRRKGILGDPKDYISDLDRHERVRQTVTKTKKDKGALTQKAREEKEEERVLKRLKEKGVTPGGGGGAVAVKKDYTPSLIVTGAGVAGRIVTDTVAKPTYSPLVGESPKTKITPITTLAGKNYTTETIGEKNRYNKKKGTKTTEFIPL